MEDALERLSLDKTQQFVQITSATRVELVYKGEMGKDLQPQWEHRITKSKIGGLEKQIQLVEESMDYALGYRFLPAGKPNKHSLCRYYENFKMS